MAAEPVLASVELHFSDQVRPDRRWHMTAEHAVALQVYDEVCVAFLQVVDLVFAFLGQLWEAFAAIEEYFPQIDLGHRVHRDVVELSQGS